MNKAAVLISVCVAAGVAPAIYFSGTGSGVEPVPSVRTLRSRSESPEVVARALGKVEATSGEIGVSSDITGRIAEILVEEGDVVEMGTPLARLEGFVYESRVGAARAAVGMATARKKLLDAGARREEIEIARAFLTEAEATERLAIRNWERSSQLVEAGLLSQGQADADSSEVDAARARVAAARERLAATSEQTRREELEAAEAELELRRNELRVVEAELAKTVLRAPIRGTIIRTKLRIGEAVSSLQVEPVVTIADMTSLQVRAEVDEIDLGKLRVGQPVRLELLALKGKVLGGKVIRIGNSMGRRKTESNDPNEREDVRVLEVIVDIDEDEVLPLGLRMTVSFLE